MKYTTDSFIEKAKTVHGDRFTYEKVNYINSREKIIITCPTHGDFTIEPSSHLRGTGCKGCQYDKPSVRKYSEEEVLEKFFKVHGGRYDYSKFTYNGAKTKSTIICNIHGKFEQTPQLHMMGSGCPTCGKKIGGRPSNTFHVKHPIIEGLNTKPQISKVNKVNPNNNYLTEKRLIGYLKEIFPREIFIYNRQYVESNTKFRPDFLCRNLKLIIEFNGFRHYTSNSSIENDKVKRKTFEELGFTVIEIPYFVQLDSNTLEYYFGKFNYSKEFNPLPYPHGFINSKALLPIDFSVNGYKRFLKEVSELPNSVRESIYLSLDKKSKELGFETY